MSKKTMRRCYLHVGTPKTGTTTLQRFLHEHGGALAPFGYLVPRAGAGPKGGHHRLLHALNGTPLPVQFSGIIREFLDEAAAHPDTEVLISTELLESYFKHRPKDNPVLSFLREAGFEVVLLGYFRNQPQRLSSGYSQAVKALRTVRSFEERVARLKASGALDYTFWQSFTMENGCALRARPFNHEVRSSGLIEDFLATLGVTDANLQYDVASTVNRSPGPSTVAAVQEVMRRASAQGHRWTHRQRVHAMKLIGEVVLDPQFVEKPFCGLDTGTAREVQAFYRPSNDRFAEAAWGADWASIFKEDVNAEFERNVFDPATASAEAKERFAAILDRLWSGMQPIMDNPRLQAEQEMAPANLN
jgi:hypothetical protein